MPRCQNYLKDPLELLNQSVKTRAVYLYNNNKHIGLTLRHVNPISSSNNTKPIQLPQITYETRLSKGKTSSRLEMYNKKMRQRDSSVTNHYKIPQKNNKSFLDIRSNSKQNILIERLVPQGRESRRQSIERKELFEKHFSKVLRIYFKDRCF